MIGFCSLGKIGKIKNGEFVGCWLYHLFRLKKSVAITASCLYCILFKLLLENERSLLKCRSCTSGFEQITFILCTASTSLQNTAEVGWHQFTRRSKLQILGFSKIL